MEILCAIISLAQIFQSTNYQNINELILYQHYEKNDIPSNFYAIGGVLCLFAD